MIYALNIDLNANLFAGGFLLPLCSLLEEEEERAATGFGKSVVGRPLPKC